MLPSLRFSLFALALVAALCGEAAFAETDDLHGPGFREIELRDGRILAGDLMPIDAKRFRLRTLNATVTLDWKTVRRATEMTESDLYLWQARRRLLSGDRYDAARLIDKALAADPELQLGETLGRLMTDLMFYTDASEKGQTLQKEAQGGILVQYIPSEAQWPVRIIVLVHDALVPNTSAIEAAFDLVEEWTPLARKRGLILLAPAFDRANFASGRDAPHPGYRGLLGREMRADAFLDGILDRYRFQYPAFDGKALLFGRGGGGAFVARYVVQHPERVAAALIGNASGFAFPDPNTYWPNGQNRLRGTFDWSDPARTTTVDFTPVREKWDAAAALPITVALSPSASTRVQEETRQWATYMNNITWRHGRVGGVRLARTANNRPGPADARHLFHARSIEWVRTDSDAVMVFTALADWAEPEIPCDVRFRHVMVGLDRPLRYRYRSEPGVAYRIMLGFIEGYHREAGARMLEVWAEGKVVRTIDPYAEAGHSRPAPVSFETSDTDGSGFVEIEVRAAKNSRDRNTVLSSLWVFDPTSFPGEAEVLAGGAENAALAVIDAMPSLSN
jgi:pimeloyl-ACP methyl ester carboxylesterase